MKKIISILLVAMLILGMFPVTPLTANAATRELTLDLANATYRTSYSTTQQVYSQNGITVTNDKAGASSNVYNASSQNHARFYKGSTVTIACTSMTKIVLECSGSSYLFNLETSEDYSSTTSGTTVTVTFTSTVDTYTFTMSKNQARVKKITVTQEFTTDCTHAETTSGNDGEAATCTEIGYTDSVVCANTECNMVITPRQEIPALGHSYSEGVCANCSNAMIDPSVETQATLMTELPAAGNIVAIYHPTSSNVMTSAADGSALDAILSKVSDDQLPYDDTVAQLVVGVVDEYYTFKTTDGTYLATDSDGGSLFFTETMDDLAQWTITANGTAWNVINKASTSSYGDQALEYYNGYFTTYSIKSSDTAFSLVFYLVGQDTCQHSNTEVLAAVSATCTESGLTEGLKCSDCGAILTAQETIDALDHNYVDGVCSHPNCGAEEPDGKTPVTELVAGQYVVVATNTTVSYAMDTTIGTKLSAIEVTIDGGILVGTVDETVELPIWTIEACGDGWAFTNGTKYLGYASSTNFASSDTAYQWNATSGTNGFKFISAAATTRGIFFQNSGSRFGAYSTTNESGYVTELTLYKVSAAATPVAEVNGTEYTSMDDALAEITANGGTLKLLADAESIAYDGELKLDLNGFAATNVTGTDIRVYDSTATYTKNEDETVTVTEGTGTLTLTEGSTVVTDNTENGVRYIALNNNGTYTFHILEMKLTAVTLRTSAAGIYYKAIVNCDETLAQATSQYGIALSTSNMPGANFATEYELNVDVNGWTVVEGNVTSGQVFTSGSVFGIFKEDLTNNAARGEVKIYANAYIVVDNITIMADLSTGDKADDEGFDGISYSLKDVMQRLEENFNSTSLDDAQRERIAVFYRDWSDAMSTWKLTKIAQAAAELPAA